jgi:two-component system, NarL family, nitrate/nitrite response regulator NarL
MTAMKKIKIIIADDHLLFINGLQLLLKEESWVEITDIANDGKELLDILHTNQPDLILLDLNMPHLNGLEASRHIKQNYPAVKLIILSTYNEEHLIEKAKNIGINGYLLKNCNREELLQAISLVMNNQSSFPYFEPKEYNLFDKEDNFLKQFNLTKRELEIINLIKNGFTNQQIADKLFLSIYTIETHRKNIMHKLRLNTPAALMKFILENNL